MNGTVLKEEQYYESGREGGGESEVSKLSFINQLPSAGDHERDSERGREGRAGD